MISVWVHHNFRSTVVVVTALLGYLDLELLTNKVQLSNKYMPPRTSVPFEIACMCG